MKSFIQYSLQKVLGFQNYLFLFSLYSSFKIDFLKDDNEFRYFIELIKKFDGNAIADIGANVGVTVSALSKSYSSYQVMAFEPVPSNYQTLSSIVQFKSLKNVWLFPLAIGETTKVVEIATPIQKGVIKHGLSQIHNSEDKQKSKIYIDKCQMKTLDSVLMEYPNQHLSAIKIDVENYEFNVLKGAFQTIKTYRPLIFAELWEDYKKYDCIELMQNLGYKTKVLVQNKLVNYDNHISLNYFFIPAEKSDI